MNQFFLKNMGFFTGVLITTFMVTSCSTKPVVQSEIDPAAKLVIAPMNYKGRIPASVSDFIPGRFIVTVTQDSDPLEVARGQNIRPIFVYRNALKGFAANISDAARARLMGNPKVVSIEQDRRVYANGTQSSAVWGLDRINQRSLPLDGNYSYVNTGNGVTAYVIDTGILYSHQEFGGAATFGYDALGGNGTDCNGHGTHVAGTIGGTTYGVAKDVNLVAVRVLDCSGSGSNSGVIAGIDWVAANRVTPAVANLSLSGGASYAVDLAIHNLVAANVVTVVAAGNNNLDACGYSPARAPNAITIGATTSADARASYSNYGKCVDFFGPGSSIKSSWYTSTSATNTISGTSMATPHVAGVAALYLEGHPSASPVEVRDALLSFTSKGKVTSASTTNNHLLNNNEATDGTGDYGSPSVSITAPLNNSTLTKNKTTVLTTQTYDNIAVTKVEYLMNGSLVCTSTTAPFSCNYRTPATPGTYTMQARASDAAGNITASNPVTILIR